MSPAYPKPEARAKGSVPAETVALLRGRSGGKCEYCHLAPATEKHHRKYRGRGGTHAIENLLHLCGGKGGMFGGNHSGCHGLAHSGDGQSLGLSVSSEMDPAEVTFRDYAGVEFCLDSEGFKTIVPRKVVEDDRAAEKVGVDRHVILHIALVSSEEDRVFILHSAKCLVLRRELGQPLTECLYSQALENDIDMHTWGDFVDAPVALAVRDGRLVPGVRMYRRNEVPGA